MRWLKFFLGDGEVTAIELGDTWCFPDLDLIRLQFRSHSHCSVCCSCLHITVVVAVVSGLEHSLFCIVSNIGIKPVPTCIQENGSGECFCVAYLRFVDDDCVYDCSIYIPTLSYVQRACVH